MHCILCRMREDIERSPLNTWSGEFSLAVTDCQRYLQVWSFLCVDKTLSRGLELDRHMHQHDFRREASSLPMCHPNHLKRPAATTTLTSPPLPPSTSSSWQTSSSPRLTALRVARAGQCGRWKRRSTALPSGTSSSFWRRAFCRRTFATDQPSAINLGFGDISAWKVEMEIQREWKYKENGNTNMEKNIFRQLWARKHIKVVCSS